MGVAGHDWTLAWFRLSGLGGGICRFKRLREEGDRRLSRFFKVCVW